jgi:sulfite dehydrogenase (quinone) subunit SoeC
MHPAYSVIFFTVSSGIGYGLLGLIGVLVALGLLPLDKSLGLIGLGLGFAAVSAGLLSSTFHLGHPERAWRAISQWKSSWLSREGIAAIVTYAPIILLAYCWVYWGEKAKTLEIWAVLTALGAVLTVYCTGKIYQSLRTIHQWHNGWTIPNYLLLGLAGGALWLVTIVAMLGHDASATTPLTTISIGAVGIAWAVKIRYWLFIDTTTHDATPETATGLGRFGTVSQFEGPHTSANYLMKEMGYQVARKHAAKLRYYVHVFAFALPLLLTFTGMSISGGVAAACAAVAALSMTFGLVIERWLFFAEANHVVTLFYGAKSA